MYIYICCGQTSLNFGRAQFALSRKKRAAKVTATATTTVTVIVNGNGNVSKCYRSVCRIA